MTKGDRIIDPIDRRILAIVQHDADQSADAIGEQVFLSPSAVQRRLARLKKDGVIERVTAVIDPKAVDLKMTVLVEIELETERRDAVEPFRRWVRQESAVQSCWYITGESDYLLIVMVPDLDAYTAFIDRMTGGNLAVRRYRSLISLATIKRSIDVDLDGFCKE